MKLIKENSITKLNYQHLVIKEWNEELLVPVKIKRRLRVDNISNKENIQDISNEKVQKMEKCNIQISQKKLKNQI